MLIDFTFERDNAQKIFSKNSEMPEVIWHLLEKSDGTDFLKRANLRLTSQSTFTEVLEEGYMSVS